MTIKIAACYILQAAILQAVDFSLEQSEKPGSVRVMKLECDGKARPEPSASAPLSASQRRRPASSSGI